MDSYWNVYRRRTNHIFLLDFKLVAEKKECTGSEIQQGTMKTIQLCHNACKGKSSMFAYGLAPDRCNGDGCRCICETSSKNGTCTMTSHSGYNLYAYTKGEIFIIIIFYINLKNIFDTRSLALS